MRILVLGGSGDVARLVVPHLAQRHDVTVADIRPGDSASSIRRIRVDAVDEDELLEASAEQDAVVYFAMGRKSDWGDHEPGWRRSHFELNLWGLDSALRAAASAGVRRFVHASTMSVFRSFPALPTGFDPPVPDACDTYGLTKRLGEDLCRARSSAWGLDVVSLRLSEPVPDDVWERDHTTRPWLTAASDVAMAFERALVVDLEHFRAFSITGDIDARPAERREARDLLGWNPRPRNERRAAS
ncbi:NAD-dependent epimerase/dehydratase family protein [Microbacterium sp. 179-I 3D3 NHS]|uniref:NAD-dependent epimerase/dehydratase family protein n=1 Tax=unclassified Microbacterium TaxID=2609290 RepID=UPI0039A2418D